MKRPSVSCGTTSTSLTYVDLKPQKVVGWRGSQEKNISRNKSQIFPNLMKIISKNTIIPKQKNMEKNKSRHIVIKLHKKQWQRENFKAARGEKPHYEQNKGNMATDLSETMQPRRLRNSINSEGYLI